jgi:hypothetical protein
VVLAVSFFGNARPIQPYGIMPLVSGVPFRISFGILSAASFWCVVCWCENVYLLVLSQFPSLI